MKLYENLAYDFHSELPIYETTDPVHADVLNLPIRTLFENTLSLYAELQDVRKNLFVTNILNTIIPTTGWLESTDYLNTGLYYIDLLFEEVDSSMSCFSTIHEEDLLIASKSGLRSTIESRDGAIRFFCFETIPTSPIRCEINVFKSGVDKKQSVKDISFTINNDGELIMKSLNESSAFLSDLRLRINDFGELIMEDI